MKDQYLLASRIPRPFTLSVRSALIIAVAAPFLCFLPSLNNELLIWDDIGYIVDNDNIKSLSLDTIIWAFTDYSSLNYWAPLTWISLAIDHALWGTNPVGYHLTNILLHALNAGLFFLVFHDLLTAYGKAYPGLNGKSLFFNTDAITLCALLASLYHAIHPLRVESVAWAAERKDVLSMFFGLSAMLLYLRYARTPAGTESNRLRTFAFFTSPPYLLALTCYGLSLFSKAMFIALPAALLVLDWLPLRRFSKQRAKSVIAEKLPFLVIAAPVSVMTIRAHLPTTMSFDESNFLSRLLNALKSITAYLQKTIWPSDLSPFYLHPRNITDIGPEYIVAIAVFVVSSGTCILLLKRWPAFMALWLFYLITLFPFLGFSQSGAQAMADRLSYLPGLAASLLIAVGCLALFVRASSRIARGAVLSGVLILLLVNCGLTLRQISFWKDDVSLWTRAIDLQPHSIGRAYFQRAFGYLAKGDHLRALEDANEALLIANRKNYRKTEDIYSLRATIYQQLGNYQAAIADYSSALVVDNSPKSVHYLLKRGDLYRALGNNERAEADYRSADATARAQGMQ